MLLPGPWLVLGAALMLGILACLAALARAQKKAGLRPAYPSLWRRLQSENGTATVEFALVMPILMFFVMTLIQVGLLLVGYQYVQHAAYRAARTAIVQIPTVLGAEKFNQVSGDSTSGKQALISAAAQYALLPVCGELEGGSSTGGTALVGGLKNYFSAYGADSPAWIDNLVAARLEYAIQKTKVTLLKASDGQGNDAGNYTTLPEINGPFTYGPKDPVVVQVTHAMNLSVPYVRAMFSSGNQTTRAGPGAFATIHTRAVMVNEGIDPTIQPAPFPRVSN